jgi:hypothetical protein
MIKLTTTKKIILGICIIIIIYTSYKLYNKYEYLYPPIENKLLKDILTNEDMSNIITNIISLLSNPLELQPLEYQNGIIQYRNYTLIKNPNAFFIIVNNPIQEQQGTYLISVKIHNDGFKLNGLYVNKKLIVNYETNKFIIKYINNNKEEILFEKQNIKLIELSSDPNMGYDNYINFIYNSKSEKNEISSEEISIQSILNNISNNVNLKNTINFYDRVTYNNYVMEIPKYKDITVKSEDYEKEILNIKNVNDATNSILKGTSKENYNNDNYFEINALFSNISESENIIEDKSYYLYYTQYQILQYLRKIKNDKMSIPAPTPAPTPAPKPKLMAPTPKPKLMAPTPKPKLMAPIPKLMAPKPAPKPKLMSPKSKLMTPKP